MQFSQKIINALPLKELSAIDGTVFLRGEYLDKQAIKLRLQKAPIPFMIADVGHPFKFIDTDQCFLFWKTEVKSHLAHNIDLIDLDLYPDSYAYIASEWIDADQNRLILLEKMH